MTDFIYHNYNFVKPVADLNAMRLNLIAKTTKRIARKKGQPAGSDKHSDLYTDENPKGTIHGLKFATVQDAKDSVKKIESSGKSHAHKIQAAIAMEQRARVMGKVGAADVYRAYIEKMKKITKQRNEDFSQRDVNDLEKFADRILKKYNIDLPSSTSQYELSEEKKNNIPDWYTGTVSDEGSIIKNEETGKEIKLTGLETSIYNVTQMNNIFLGNIEKDIESGKADKIILESPIFVNMMVQLVQGKLWLKENNLEAYKVLFGEPEEDNNPSSQEE